MRKRRTRTRKAAKRVRIRPPKVEFEFTDLDLTAFGGASVLAQTARWLGRLRPGDVKGLWRAAVEFAGRVAPSVVDPEVGTKGYVPLFIDATGVEVDGRLFQWARKDCGGNRGYWLHATFLGGLWSAGQLQPGGGRVTLNWRTLLDWTAGMPPTGTPVWLRADNACHKGELVRLCAERRAASFRWCRATRRSRSRATTCRSRSWC